MIKSAIKKQTYGVVTLDSSTSDLGIVFLRKIGQLTTSIRRRRSLERTSGEFVAVTVHGRMSILESSVDDVENIRVDVDPVVVALNERGDLKRLRNPLDRNHE